ncbi:hypothetical protein B6J29_29120, partial [Klebsiella pneumoniae]
MVFDDTVSPCKATGSPAKRVKVALFACAGFPYSYLCRPVQIKTNDIQQFQRSKCMNDTVHMARSSARRVLRKVRI